MPHENKTRYAVLGLLNHSPMTGYQMGKVYESSLGHFWSESYSHLYAILKVLETEGLATATVELGQGRPNRRLYTITDAGRKELADWLVRPVDEQRERVEVLLKVFHGQAVGPAATAEHIRTFRAQHQALLARYARYAAELQTLVAEDPGHLYILLTLRCGQAISEALLGWCDGALEALAELSEARPGRLSEDVAAEEES